MEKILYIFLFLIIFSLVFGLLEKHFSCTPSEKWWRKEKRTDVIYWFFTPLFTKLIMRMTIAVMVVIFFTGTPEEIYHRLSNRDTLIAQQPLWVQLALMLFIGDVVGYIIHRWFHKKPLWKFHAIHHSSRKLDWLSSVRVHPINDWFARWIQVIVLLALGFNIVTTAGYTLFITIYTLFIHSNIQWGYGWFRYILVSPRYHRWHHSCEAEAIDKNFAGFFPVIDIIGGTYYMPKDKIPYIFGITGNAVPEGFIGQLLYPFKK